MKTNTLITNLVTFLSVVATTTVVSAQSACVPVSTVDNFNVSQYASAPWYIQQQAVNTYTSLEDNRCVTAQYKLKDNSSYWWDFLGYWTYALDVYNYAEDAEGVSKGGNLCADFDENMPSQLEVAPCFVPKLAAGPYWIVAYQEGLDGYALVAGGQPNNVSSEDDKICGPTGTDVCCKTGTGINNSGLWILTRQTNPSNDLVDEVREIAQQKGFATSVLFDVVHDENCNVPDINEETSFLRLRK